MVFHLFLWWLLPMGFVTMRTQPFHHIVHRVHHKTAWDGYWRYFHVVQTIGALALLTIEMGMHIIVACCIMAVTQLITHPVATILYHMHQVMLAKEGQRTKHSRLVYRLYLRFQLQQRQWASCCFQSPDHHDPVRRRLDAMTFQTLDALLATHTPYYIRNDQVDHLRSHQGDLHQSHQDVRQSLGRQDRQDHACLHGRPCLQRGSACR